MNPASAMNTLSPENFNTKKPEEVIKPEFLETYKTLHSDIWNRLVQVHTNIIILEKIKKFPFEHIYALQENIFWTMVNWNFLYVTIVFIYNLTNDKGYEKHTLLSFKNKVLQWMKESGKQAYQNKLKNNKFSKKTKEILDKVAKMRSKVIAHRILNRQDGLMSKDVEGVTLAEVSQAYDDVEKLFRDCSFGGDYLTTFYIPGIFGGKPITKDIDELLDLIVKNSFWLNQPERRAPFWPLIRQHRDPKDIEELNFWRRKFDLPDA